jgi:hypothetical protein
LFVYSKFKDATLNFSIKNSYGDVINESSQIYDPDTDSFYYNVSLYETGAQVGINNSPYLVAENFISNETNLNFTFTQQQNSSYFSPDGAQRYYKLLLDIYNRGLKSSALATVYHYPAIITDISVDDGSTLIPIGTENESGFLTGYVNLNITFTGGIGKNYIVKNIDIYTGSQSGTSNSLNGFSLLKNVGVFSDSLQQTFTILPTEVPSNQVVFYKIVPYDDFGQGITFSNSVSGYLSYNEPLLFWGEALPPVLNSEARITGYFSGLESPERVSGRDGAIIFQDGEEIDQDFYVLKSGQWKRLAIYEEISGQLGPSSSGDFSGYAVSGFDRSITGITVTGDDAKTITLFKEDGSFLTASFIDNSASGDSNTGYLTGYVAKTETGDFYPRSNPSGYVTGAVVRPSETGVFITNSQTGQFVGDSETGDFVTNNQTGAFLTTGAADSRYALQSATGDFVTTGQTGNFVVSNQTGAFLTTGAADSRYALQSQTGVFVTTGQTGVFITSSETGQFYPTSNPSGYITGVDLSAYVTGDVVRPSETGDFITTSQTGQFVGDSETGAFLTTSTADGKYVSLTGDQTISGIKTFTGTIIAVSGIIGSTNTVSGASDSSIIAGNNNRITNGSANAILAGISNVITGSANFRSAIIGGQSSIITSANGAAIIGGQGSIITSSNRSVILGGLINQISGNSDSVIGGGADNQIKNSLGSFAVGYANLINSSSNCSAFGSTNTISGTAVSHAFGYGTKADRYGIKTFGSDYFEIQGDAQNFERTLYANSQNGEVKTLSSDAETVIPPFFNLFYNQSSKIMLATIKVLGVDEDANVSQYMRKAVISVGSTGLQQIKHIESIGTDTEDAGKIFFSTNDANLNTGNFASTFCIFGSGLADNQTRWMAHVNAIELNIPPSYP